MHVLSTHPQVQKRLRTEILDLPEDSDLDYTKIDNLSYLNNFCREILRVYAPGTYRYLFCK